MNSRTRILADVADYYSTKLAEHGTTARGVDWNGEESQITRFEQLAKIIRQDGRFSVNDVGCGYGALLDHLKNTYGVFSYAGNDISEDMIRAAQTRYADIPDARFNVGGEPDGVADYSVASGVFNVRLAHANAEWKSYLEATLDVLNRTSQQGFAFNCLSAYSDKHKQRPYLFYADPCALFDLCKQRYSAQIALLHDYGLYEFTILVRKRP